MKAVQLSYYCQSANPRRMQSQVFQRVRSKDAGISPAKDRLHHKSKVYILITKTAVIHRSSPFYCSDICQMLVDIVPMKM